MFRSTIVLIFMAFLLFESIHSATKGPEQLNDEIKEVDKANSKYAEVMEILGEKDKERNPNVINILDNFVNDKNNQNLKKMDIARRLKKEFGITLGKAIKITRILLEMIDRVKEFEGVRTSDHGLHVPPRVRPQEHRVVRGLPSVPRRKLQVDGQRRCALVQRASVLSPNWSNRNPYTAHHIPKTPYKMRPLAGVYREINNKAERKLKKSLDLRVTMEVNLKLSDEETIDKRSSTLERWKKTLAKIKHNVVDCSVTLQETKYHIKRARIDKTNVWGNKWEKNIVVHFRVDPLRTLKAKRHYGIEIQCDGDQNASFSDIFKGFTGRFLDNTDFAKKDVKMGCSSCSQGSGSMYYPGTTIFWCPRVDED
eukprot:221359_1